MAAIVDPILSPDRQNRIIEMTVKHYEDSVRLLMKNLWPHGYTTGESPFQTKMEELLSLVLAHDQNLTVATDPAALAGDQARAQQGLLREQELREVAFAP